MSERTLKEFFKKDLRHILHITTVIIAAIIIILIIMAYTLEATVLSPIPSVSHI